MGHRRKNRGRGTIDVSNAERSRQWYEDVLGLHTYECRPGWAAFMSADVEQSHEVALMEVGDDAPLQAKRQGGLNHLAFMMESLDDLKDAYYRMREKRVKFDHISDHGLSHGLDFPDPPGTAPCGCDATTLDGRECRSPVARRSGVAEVVLGWRSWRSGRRGGFARSGRGRRRGWWATRTDIHRWCRR